MQLNCLLAGVGGQGTVLASKIIAQTAISKNSFARTSETIGMAQRGGCVVSHVRIGTQNCSPAIPKGMADLIIGFEPAETVRGIEYLKPQGRLLVNVNPITPVTASLGSSYQVDDILKYLQNGSHEVIFVDGQKLCTAAGSAKVLNVVMLGVAIKKELLPFSIEDVLNTIKENLPQRFIGPNSKALEVGYHFEQYR
jgi:indolepyruvate ferredoxin oxidoreductase beta subunit